MIEDADHPIWTDKVAHHTLDMVMARFHRLCLAALEKYHESLRELRDELRALRGLEKMKKMRGYHFSMKRSNWMKPSTSPTSSSTEKVFKLIEKVRDCNDIFCTLIWQAAPRPFSHKSGPSPAEDGLCPNIMGPVRESRHHFSCMQRASQILYETLSRKCRDQEVHSLNISLDFEHAKTGAIVRGKDIRFKIVITMPYPDVPYRFTVDAAHSVFCIYQTTDEAKSFRKKKRT